MTPAPKEPSAAEVLAAWERKRLWVAGDMIAGKTTADRTILRALRVLAACEEVATALPVWIDALDCEKVREGQSFPWAEMALEDVPIGGLLAHLEILATLTGGPEDGR